MKAIKEERKMNITLREIKKKAIIECDKELYFKQININEKFKFCEYIDEKYINFKNAVLHLPCIKLIDTIEGISYEGQKLSGKKLVLCGHFELSFFVDYENKCFYVKKNIPLSTFIVVPTNTTEEKPLCIFYCIEDVTITNIECNYVFISITVHLEYDDNDNI